MTTDLEPLVPPDAEDDDGFGALFADDDGPPAEAPPEPPSASDSDDTSPGLSDEQEVELTRQYAETHTPVAVIARRFGVKEAQVYRIAQRHGAALRGRAQPALTRDERIADLDARDARLDAAEPSAPEATVAERVALARLSELNDANATDAEMQSYLISTGLSAEEAQAMISRVIYAEDPAEVAAEQSEPSGPPTDSATAEDADEGTDLTEGTDSTDEVQLSESDPVAAAEDVPPTDGSSVEPGLGETPSEATGAQAATSPRELKLVAVLRPDGQGFKARLAVGASDCDPVFRLVDVPTIADALTQLAHLSGVAESQWKEQPRYPAAPKATPPATTTQTAARPARARAARQPAAPAAPARPAAPTRPPAPAATAPTRQQPPAAATAQPSLFD